MSSAMDSQLKSIWSSIFSRKGTASSSTKLWEDWDEDRRHRLSDVVLQKELPVLLSFSEPENVVLLTTQRLVVGNRSVDVKDIVDVIPAEFSTREKASLKELDIVVNTKEKFRVPLESGSAYFGIWSVLLHIARSNGAKTKTQ